MFIRLAFLFLTLTSAASGAYYYKTGQLPFNDSLQKIRPAANKIIAALPANRILFLPNTESLANSESSNETPAVLGETDTPNTGIGLTSIQQDAQKQLQAVTQKTQEVTSETNKVVSQALKDQEENNKPLHQSAIEYAQYQYCKQVIAGYEAQ